MRAFILVVLAFCGGFVVATVLPDGAFDADLAATSILSDDLAAPVLVAQVDDPDGDAVPGRLPDADQEARPIPSSADLAPTPHGAGETDIALASVEQPADTDWPQWGGSSLRNNAPRSEAIPVTWELGQFDRRTREWDRQSARGVRWIAELGSQSYGNPVVAGGRVFVGTNNAAGYSPRYPKNVDLGCLLAFAEDDGEFLWQYSCEKLDTGEAHDWPMQGICCSPLVEADRMWLVDSRGQVVCLDPHGFRDGENDGPCADEPAEDQFEADVVWKFDMMDQLGVRQHNMASCSVTSLGDLLFVCTSNGVDETELKVAAPTAPSFLALQKETGEVVWTDNSPGENILHGQWSSPAAGVLGGVPQVVFAGGDGWLYSFRADEGLDGRPTLLWKFDCNPKDTEWKLSGRGTRNNLIATPVLYDDRVYVAVGQDPENGEGQGHLWCVDPTRRGDVSPQLVVKQDDPDQVVPPRRIKAVDPEKGETVIDNPNSAAIWHFDTCDVNGDGTIDFEETMHRTLGTVAIAEGLLFVADYSGLFHCIDAKTGRPRWNYDMFSSSWGSPLITQDHVYIGDEDGDLTVFRLTAEAHEPVAEINMLNSVYSTPTVANGVLYITARTRLFAIVEEAPAK